MSKSRKRNVVESLPIRAEVVRQPNHLFTVTLFGTDGWPIGIAIQFSKSDYARDHARRVLASLGIEGRVSDWLMDSETNAGDRMTRMMEYAIATKKEQSK